MDDLTGQTIGRYVVEGLFRRFGIDALYLARDPALGRTVLLKIGASVGGHALAGEFLRHEARLLALLDHPGVQKVYDTGEHDGRVWFVAEHFTGSSVRAMIDEGPPGLDESWRVFIQVAEILSYVHRRGIVHRNLNPGVIRFDVNGRPHLSAFSVAAETEQATALPANGSGAYMAPELVGATGYGGGPEVDVWSLGVQMHEALSGSHPFSETMKRGRFTPLAERVPDLPGAICRVVDRCLREAPEERYKDAGELLIAMREAHGGGESESEAERVFVSHSSKDRAFVEQELIPVLERGGNPTWYAKKDIESASAWERTIVRGLDSCPWFLLVMSPRSAASDWVKDEVHWAVQHRPKRILPLLFEAVDPYLFHMRIPRIQHVDFRGDHAAGRTDLLDRLRRG